MRRPNEDTKILFHRPCLGMNKQALAVAGILIAIPIALLGIWALRGASMEGDFAEALRTGNVHGVPVELSGKQWSSEELATIQVLLVPDSQGRQQALTRSLHARGRIVVSPNRYQYQATVRDGSTQIVHVFGYRRSEPLSWCWDSIHPDSLPLHLQRRMRQVEGMQDRQQPE